MTEEVVLLDEGCPVCARGHSWVTVDDLRGAKTRAALTAVHMFDKWKEAAEFEKAFEAELDEADKEQ